MKLIMIGVLALCPYVLSQSLDHRRFVPDFAVDLASSSFHVGFLASGSAPVQMVLREYVPPEDGEIAVVELPGTHVGIPATIPGTTAFLVGSSTPTGSESTRAQGYVTKVEVIVSNGFGMGLALLGSAPCGNLDPAALFFDAQHGYLYMLDHAHLCLRRAAYNAAGPLPVASAWTVIASASQWGDDLALVSSVPLVASADSITWFSPYRPQHFRQVDPSTNPSNVQAQPNNRDILMPLTDVFPDARVSWNFSTIAAPGTPFQVLTADRTTVLHQGTVNTSESTTVPALPTLGGSVGDRIRIDIGSRGAYIHLQTRYGRPCPLPVLATGRQIPGGLSLVNSRLLPLVSIGYATGSFQGWLLLGWRDQNSQDPLLWQSDKAVIDVAARGVAIPFVTSAADIWSVASRAIPIPNDNRLDGAVLLTQYVYKAGSDYAISDIVCHRVKGLGQPLPSAQDRESAIIAWRASTDGLTPALNTSELLQSILSR